MSLSGKVEDLGLADSLQIIARQGKSGKLRLKTERLEFMLAIAEGNIVNVQRIDEHEGGRAPSGFFGIGRLRDRSTQLLPNASLDDSPWAVGRDEPGMRRRRKNLILVPFTWEKGHWKFVEEAMPKGDRGHLAVGLGEVLFLGVRIAQEWPLVSERIPSRLAKVTIREPLLPDLVAQSTEDLEFDDFDTGDTEADYTPEESGETTAFSKIADEVGATERLVFEYCRPNRLVESVLEETPLPEVETLLALSHLVGAGHIGLVRS
jgi:hypothetical protein